MSAATREGRQAALISKKYDVAWNLLTKIRDDESVPTNVRNEIKMALLDIHRIQKQSDVYAAACTTRKVRQA